jgi:hypothetical protein
MDQLLWRSVIRTTVFSRLTLQHITSKPFSVNLNQRTWNAPFYAPGGVGAAALSAIAM